MGHKICYLVLATSATLLSRPDKTMSEGPKDQKSQCPASFYQRCLQLLYSSCTFRSQTPPPTPACFVLASLAFSFACVNREAVNSRRLPANSTAVLDRSLLLSNVSTLLSEWKVYKRHGCLPFVRMNRLGWLLNNGKGFSRITIQTEWDGAYDMKLQFHFPLLLSVNERLETGKCCKWWENFPRSVLNGIKITTSGNFRTDFPENYCSGSFG